MAPFQILTMQESDVFERFTPFNHDLISSIVMRKLFFFETLTMPVTAPKLEIESLHG